MSGPSTGLRHIRPIQHPVYCSCGSPVVASFEAIVSRLSILACVSATLFTRISGLFQLAIALLEKVGGASCGECHTLTGDKKPPSAIARAKSDGRNDQPSGSRTARGNKVQRMSQRARRQGAVQVSVPQLKEHRGGAFQKCGSCHNGRRAFGGELINNACMRCHGRNMM